jgi:hypothetical protein
MTLMTAHRILIGTATAFFAFYGLWEWAGRAAGPGGVWRGGLSVLAALGLASYFRTLFRRGSASGDGGEGR